MSLHERRTIFVKINGSLCDRIFCIGTVGEFAGALKDLRPPVRLDHRLQQQLDDLGMKIAANQHLDGRTDERHVIRWNGSVDVNYALGQYERNEVGINSREGLRHWEGQELDVGSPKQGFDRRRVRRTDNPHDIQLAVLQRFDCRISGER